MNPIIIPAAGVGSRLGMGIPKSLINLCGKTLIQWQLEQLSKYEIRIVVGYYGEAIENIVKDRAEVIYNYNYLTTNTLDSVKLAVKDDDELVTIIDGDILFKQETVELINNTQCIGIKTIINDSPVYAHLCENKVIKFSRDEKSNYEWACMCSINCEEISKCNGRYIYQSLENSLPLDSVNINVVEIDTQNDIADAEIWVSQNIL